MKMAENTVTSTTETTQTAENAVETATTTSTDTTPTTDYEAEIARLKAENARYKSSIDKATSEAAGLKKQLRATQSEEERKAAEREESDNALRAELEELRKQTATANISKKVMAFVGEEAAANSIAEALYGAANADEVIDAINKAWVAREKRLKLEYGKVPAPAAGDGAPSVTKDEVLSWPVNKQVEFASEHPDVYSKLFTNQ